MPSESQGRRFRASGRARVAGLGALREISQSFLAGLARAALAQQMEDAQVAGGYSITLFRPLLQLAVRHRFRLAVGPRFTSIERKLVRRRAPAAVLRLVG